MSFQVAPNPMPKWDRSPEAKWARLATNAPRVPWLKFYNNLVWKQGQHFALIGPTGQGKTTMLHSLLPKHQYVTVFATKPADESMDLLIKNSGYQKMETWRSLDANNVPRRIVWPNAKKLGALPYQREVFTDAFDRIYREGGWTLALDELWFFANMLGMEQTVKLYLLQARSLKISMLVATQRPASVPLEVYDQSTHLMFWRDNDRRNLDRLSDINSRDSSLVREIVRDLDEFQVLYINTRTGQMLRTRAPFIEGI